MFIGQITLTLAKLAPEAAEAVKRLLPIFKSSGATQVIDVTKQVVEAASRSATDGGASQVAHQAKQLLPDLKILSTSLNGQLSPERRKLVNEVVTLLEQGGDSISLENKKGITELLEEIISSEQPEANGQVQRAQEASTAEPKELGKTNTESEKIKQLEAENKRLKEEAAKQQTIANREVTGDPDKDADLLADSALNILVDEVMKEDSWPSFLWGLGLKPSDAPEKREELPAYLKKKLLGEKPEDSQGFKDCMAQYLCYLKGRGERPDPDAHKLNDIQKKAFHALRASRWVAQWIPQNVRTFLGRFKLLIAPALGFLDKIPVIGHIARFVVPLFNEYVIGFLVFHGKNAEVLQNIAAKYKKEV